MTQPLATSTTSESSQAQPLLTLFSRSLLLALGGSAALCLGVVIACFYPAPHQEPPLLETVLRQSGKVALNLEQWLRTWKPISLPGWNDSPTTTNSPPVSTLPSTATQEQTLQAELAQLQTELKALSDRTAALEMQLGQRPSATSLETRLQTLAQQLAAAKEPTSNSTPTSTSSQPESLNSLFQADTLMVTLPIDILFQDSQSALRPQTKVILDNIITDLRNYQGATVRIAVHTDNLGEIRDNAELSFRQAQAVKEYLSTVLGEGYRWVVMGYGSSRPLVENTTDMNRQRNRRLEIAIDP